MPRNESMKMFIHLINQTLNPQKSKGKDNQKKSQDKHKHNSSSKNSKLLLFSKSKTSSIQFNSKCMKKNTKMSQLSLNKTHQKGFVLITLAAIMVKKV